jgi:hypothetical protein
LTRRRVEAITLIATLSSLLRAMVSVGCTELARLLVRKHPPPVRKQLKFVGCVLALAAIAEAHAYGAARVPRIAGRDLANHASLFDEHAVERHDPITFDEFHEQSEAASNFVPVIPQQ